MYRHGGLRDTIQSCRSALYPRDVCCVKAGFTSHEKLELGLPAILSKEYLLNRGVPTGKPGIYNLGEMETDITSVLVDRIIQMEPGFEAKNWLIAYENTLEALPPGIYLLIVHLGFNEEELQAMTQDHPNWGAQWRQNDFDVISNPEFQKFLIIGPVSK